MEVDDANDDECVLPSEPKDYAVCPHGPMLLFVKRKDGRSYFACSASRDRKLCPFFLFADKKKAPSAETLKVWKGLIDAESRRSGGGAAALIDDARRLKRARAQAPAERSFCKEPACSAFVFPEEVARHPNHRLTKKVTDRQLKRPMELLAPLEDPKLNAQFVFDDKSVGVVAGILDELKLHRVVCLGAPRIHEALKGKNPFRSFLLDIDARFHRFLPPTGFARFNMFNAHFFDGAEAAEAFGDFLSSCPTPPVIVVDPPFGGRVSPLFATLRHLSAAWLNACGLTADAPEARAPQLANGKNDAEEPDAADAAAAASPAAYLLPVFWAFPYFLEGSVRKKRPEFCSLDYKVLYKNHPLFQQQPQKQQQQQSGSKEGGGGGGKKGSPIRLFTNVDPSLVRLPEPDHKFCSAGCNRWVSRENRHCAKCGACTSKDGTTYAHCDICRKCVKPSRVHCADCGRCELPDHFCSAAGAAGPAADGEEEEEEEATRGEEDRRCFNCGNPGHKRRHCPQNWAGGKRKKKQQGKKGGGKKAKK